METLRNVVNSLGIPEKRERFLESESLILRVKSTMSKLTFYKPVAMYARNLDILEHETDDMVVKNTRLQNVILLKTEPNVETYESLRQDLIRLQGLSNEYYKSLQIDLRDSLLDYKLPDIYVYQGLLQDKGDMKLCRHIIIPGTYQTYEDESEVGTVIYPFKEKESNRKLRHFYDKVSFKYLEGISTDLSYDLEGKRLGKVRIK